MVKKIIAGLLIIAAIMGLMITVLDKGAYNIYKDAAHVSGDEVLEKTGNKTVYYYYQDTCHYCNSIKDQVTNLQQATTKKAGVDFKMVDMKDSKNQTLWIEESDPKYIDDPKELDVVDDIRVVGTPTMLYVDEDGKVIDYQMGAKVFEIMQAANDDFNLGLKFDPSQYGKS